MTRPQTTPLHVSFSSPSALLVAAAWAVAEARWFYTDQVSFAVIQDRTASRSHVRVAVGSDDDVASLLLQLRGQVTSFGEEEVSPGRFWIVHETETAKNKNEARLVLDCEIQGSDAQLTMIRVSGDAQLDDAEGLASAIQRLLPQLAAPQAGSTKLTYLEIISWQDLVEIWTRNSTVPAGVEIPAHTAIQRNAREQPEAPAVCAHDGSLAYKELDDLATRVAVGLTEMGVKPGVVVPLYFEKSRWMPVAILGVLKAGGAFIQLAQLIPRGRIDAILSVNKPPFALVGTGAPEWLGDIVPIFNLDDVLARNPGSLDNYPLPETSPDHDAVRLFTSGSTGKPKGIVWTHRTLSSNCKDIQNVLNLGPGTRHFQTASYEFDVSMMESVAVLMAGGCLCIPLEDEGVNCSPHALTALQATSVYLTPTIARGLDPATVPTLQKLALEGEILPKDVVSKWTGKVVIYNFYGPAECPHAASCIINPASFRTGFAGSSAASLRWIVDPQNHEKLLPPGAIGELLVEGPILMDRYIGDGVTPDSVPFVTPTWLQRGLPPRFPGRETRLFKTGDLVRGDREGGIVILGRKDTQVQICAERVELAEVEHHVRRILGARVVDVAAEMVTSAGHGQSGDNPDTENRPVLVAFLARGRDVDVDVDIDGSKTIQDLTAGLDDALAELVPRTFIPKVYIPVEKIPVTAAGKTNRRELRRLGSEWQSGSSTNRRSQQGS